MINRFVLNEVSYFGPGAREVLPKEIKRLGLHKAFVATDKDLIKFGVADKVLSVLKNAGIPYEIFSDIKPNPTVANVNAGVKAFAESGADFILAIGGGSSIDTSKAIGIITNNPEFSDVVSLEGVADTKKKSVPIIALPTTAGTAAEVTINYVITDEKNEKKMVCVDPNDIPAIAIIDAELMYTLPKGLTASTGLDALTHAIEGLITKGAWEMSDMFEIKAIEMINRYLETAVNEPQNAEARNGMAVAQYIAGMAFSNVGLGVVHGMAHPLGAIFDIPPRCSQRPAVAHHHGIQCSRCSRQIRYDSQSHECIQRGYEQRRGCSGCRRRRKSTLDKSRYSATPERTGHQGKRPAQTGRLGHRRRLHARQPARGNPRHHSRPLQESSLNHTPQGLYRFFGTTPYHIKSEV